MFNLTNILNVNIGRFGVNDHKIIIGFSNKFGLMEFYIKVH